MSYKLSLVAAAVSMCICVPPVQAEEGTSWKLSGFGTVGAVHSSEGQADFVSSLAQPNGAGATSAWNTGVDSKLGGQVDLRLNSQWSGSAQLLSRHQYDNSYTPELSVAFIKWSPGAGIELRAGRVPYAAFVVSDYRNIGYSQPWVRPPIEVYGFAIDHVDGLDATWRSNVGDVGIKIQAMAGFSKQKVPQAELTAKGILGMNATADLGAATARLSYVSFAKTAFDSSALDGLFSAVRSGVPAGALFPGSPALPPDPASANQFEIENKRVGYLSLGLSYDPGAWFVNSEFGHIGGVGFNEAAKEFYLTAGTRLGAYTPYASIAKFKHSETRSSSNPLVQGVIDGFNSRDQKSLSLGLRWDFTKSTDLKVQVDRVSNSGATSKGFLINPQSSFTPGGRYTAVSVAVDFVF